MPGNFVNVKITNAYDYDLEGEVVGFSSSGVIFISSRRILRSILWEQDHFYELEQW